MYEKWKRKKKRIIRKLPLGYAKNDGEYLMMFLSWGLKSDDLKNIRELDNGIFYQKKDEFLIKDTLLRLSAELKILMQEDEFVIEAFIYELDKHNYIYTNNINPAIYALGMDETEFYTNDRYIRLMREAIKEYKEILNEKYPDYVRRNRSV